MPSLPRPGDRLAGFRIERELGHGTTGVVYLAHQEGLERKVALKVVGLPLAGDPAFRERFRREARAAAGLDHPNVVQILESGEDDTHLWLAMRLVDGPDLRVLLRRTERLDPEQAVVVIEQIASALDAAHAAGLVHRDVKPGNVLIEDGPARDLHVELADFGLARGAGADAPAGTLGYAAPEQLAGEEAGPAADVFGLGCVLFELLTGASPPAAAGASGSGAGRSGVRGPESDRSGAAGGDGRRDATGRAGALLGAQDREDDRPRRVREAAAVEPLRPSDAYPRLGGAFDPTVERATDPDPAKRFATAGELALWARAALSVPRNSMDPPTAAPLRVAAATAALPEEVFAAAPTWEIPPEERRHGWGRKLLVGLFLVAVLSALGIAFIAIGNSGAPENERQAGATTVTVQGPAARAGSGSSSAGGGSAGSGSGSGAGSASGARGAGSGSDGSSGSGSASGARGSASSGGSGASGSGSSGSGGSSSRGGSGSAGGSGTSAGSGSGAAARGAGSSSRRPSLPVPGARAQDPSGTRTPPLPALPIGSSRFGGGGWILDLPTGEGWRQTAVQELYGGTRIITRLTRPDGARLLVEALPGRTSVLGIPDGRRFPVRLPDAGRTEGALYRGGRFAMCKDGVCAAVAANGPSGGVVVVSGSQKAYGAKRLVRRAAMGLHVR